jgi:hypothetical protein
VSTILKDLTHQIKVLLHKKGISLQNKQKEMTMEVENKKAGFIFPGLLFLI